MPVSPALVFAGLVDETARLYFDTAVDADGLVTGKLELAGIPTSVLRALRRRNGQGGLDDDLTAARAFAAFGADGPGVWLQLFDPVSGEVAENVQLEVGGLSSNDLAQLEVRVRPDLLQEPADGGLGAIVVGRREPWLDPKRLVGLLLVTQALRPPLARQFASLIAREFIGPDVTRFLGPANEAFDDLPAETYRSTGSTLLEHALESYEQKARQVEDRLTPIRFADAPLDVEQSRMEHHLSEARQELVILRGLRELLP